MKLLPALLTAPLLCSTMILAGLLLGSSTGIAQTAASANYSNLSAPVGLGGSTVTSGSTVTAQSGVGDAFSGTIANAPTGGGQTKGNYIGQLYDVKALAITPDATSVQEEETVQLAAAATLDDDTSLTLEGNDLQWVIVSGPLTIDSVGYLTGGTVFLDTLATAQGSFQGFMDSIDVTVLNNSLNDYALWIAQFYPSASDPAIIGKSANPESDTDKNFLEFFLNLDPAEPDGPDAIHTSLLDISGSKYLSITYRSHLNAAASVTIEVLRSTDLTSAWRSGETVEVTPRIGIDSLTEWVTVRSLTPIAGQSQEFLKLSVVDTASGQSYQGEPVGFVRKQTTANADALTGLPMWRQGIYSGPVSAVSGNDITIDLTMVDDELTAGSSDTYFVLVTSGTLAGWSFTITANTSEAVTVDSNASVNVATLGLAAGDTIRILPYMTLGTLFASGEGIAATSDIFNPVSTVKLHDANAIGINPAPNKTYFYHDGSVMPDGAGWYDNDDLLGGLKDDITISPEECLVIRNSTSAAETLFILGHVPTHTMATPIGRLEDNTGQDNRTVNPYPAPMTLGSSAFVSGGSVATTSDVFNPVDTVKLYVNPGGINPAPNKTYFYHDGSVMSTGAGWYDNDDLLGGLQDAVSLAPGAPIVVRKATGTAGTVMWVPPLPYVP